MGWAQQKIVGPGRSDKTPSSKSKCRVNVVVMCWTSTCSVICRINLPVKLGLGAWGLPPSLVPHGYTHA